MRSDKRFVLTAEHEQTRQQRIKQAVRARRSRGLLNYVEDRDVLDAGPRCDLCGLLEPHECLDGKEVRR